MSRGWHIMFVHLGGDVVVCTKDIIAILDIESTLKSKHSKDFLNICEEEGFVNRVTDEEPRSFVVMEKIEGKPYKGRAIRKVVVYYSPISALTLQKRAKFITHRKV